MSGIAAHTRVFKTSSDMTLDPITGTMQRVVNSGMSDITITYGSNTAVVPAGKYMDVGYDGAGWYGSDTLSVLDATDLNGATLSTDAALGNSDSLISTQKAVKTYIDAKTSGIESIGVTDVSSTDLNALQTSGYYEGNNLTNSPDGTSNKFYIEVIQSLTAGYTWQQATTADQSSTVSFNSYERKQVNNTWTEWRRRIKHYELIEVKANFWTISAGAPDKYWLSVCYGNGLFVALSLGVGIQDVIMTSPDGVNWTLRAGYKDFQWASICHGNGLFVALATGGSVMTSPDGITWTVTRIESDQPYWHKVCYGNGIFVAVGGYQTNSRVMTSSDGITWTVRTSAANIPWQSVCYGNGLFVTVSYSEINDSVMTSPDGINWTIRTSANNHGWYHVCYGDGLFVASGGNNQIMTSPDGITWTLIASAPGSGILCYGNGLYIAVDQKKVISSPDGINWTLRESAVDNVWVSVCYGNGLFVAVAHDGTGNRVMTSLP